MPVSACGSAHPGLDPDCLPCQRQRFNALEASYVRTVERDGEKIAALTNERDQLAAQVAAMAQRCVEYNVPFIADNIPAAAARYMVAERVTKAVDALYRHAATGALTEPWHLNAGAGWKEGNRLNGAIIEHINEWRRLGGAS